MMVIAFLLLLVVHGRAELIADALTEEITRSSSAATKSSSGSGSHGLTAAGHHSYDEDYEFTSLAKKHEALHKDKVEIEKPCPEGCEKHGNCNKALGRCECAIGYAGKDCSTPLWPSCKVLPSSKEMYCGTWHPKSCDCVRECAKFICPDGPASCERHYDVNVAKCFERPANYSVRLDGQAWAGGSDIPEEDDPGVQYFRGAVRGTPISREEFLDIEPHTPDGLMALPLSSCRSNCSYQGGCVQFKQEKRPHCRCHYGFTGETCSEIDWENGLQHMCWNNCQGRGECRRGFCHCKPGWWGRDCSRSKAFAAHSARRLVHRLRVYMYDLPWQMAYQPEYHLGWRDHDQIYMAWKVFGEMFLNDTAVRTENPWEANMFYIPAMTYAYSSNLGDTLVHNQRVIDYVRQTWPFFNRTKGLDHFLWLTNDRGACHWPGEEQPAMANVIKVVHFGWHHPGMPMPKGWPHPLPNKHWGCFHPIRDISAAVYWLGQSDTAAETYGLRNKARPQTKDTAAETYGLQNKTFDPKFIPTKTLLFFAGGIRHGEPDYSQNVRQELHNMFGAGQNPAVVIHDGGIPDYKDMIRNSKFCMAPSGHGWGIRLGQYMTLGCVPVIIQDDIYQSWEDLLPYVEFSIRFPKSRLPAIVELLSEVTDEEYLALRAGVARYWRAFVWDQGVGGMAYDYMISSLKKRMVRLSARHFYPLAHKKPRMQ